MKIESLHLYPEFHERLDEEFNENYVELAKQADALFVKLFAFQGLLAVALAFWLSPMTWTGSVSSLHPHVFAALGLGGALTLAAAMVVQVGPGTLFSRVTISIFQILFSILFIHLTSGRIETHFHIFGSLAFLALYRDWRVILVPTLVILLDHTVRGAVWPESVYGVGQATPWRAIEHAAWVVFEDGILLWSIKIARAELYRIAKNGVMLETTLASVEEEIVARARAYSASFSGETSDASSASTAEAQLLFKKPLS